MLSLFSCLLLTVMRMQPGVFGMTSNGLAQGDVECCMKPTARNLSKTASTVLAVGRLIR